MGTWDSFRAERTPEWQDIAQAIRDSVTMEDAVRMYVPGTVPRHHRIPCPFHNGKDYNFSYNTHGYKCFVCGASGDVIGFVKDICECSTRSDAMKRINLDFDLRLPVDGNVDITFSAEARKRREEAERRQREHDEWERRYHEALDRWTELDRIARDTPWDSEENISKACNAREQKARVGYQIELILADEPR